VTTRRQLWSQAKSRSIFQRRFARRSGRPLRRAKRRWKIERLFAWLHNGRRVVTRWERHENYLGMVQLACARILLPAFMR